MKYLLPLLLIWGSLMAQSQVVSAEWFFDSPDPGFGNATPYAAFSPNTQVTASDQINLSSLPPGLHRWNVRVKRDDGVWSHTYTRPFILLPRDSAANLVGGEWFWDHDPGFGQGQPLTLAGTRDSLSWVVVLDTLPAGIHTLQVRIKNAEGIWGHTYRRGVYVRALPDAPIQRLTYYYRGPDSNSATFTYLLSQPQHYVEVSFDPEASDLQDSVSYDLCIRAVRTDGVVSSERCETFLYRTEDTTSTHVQAPLASALRLFPNPNPGRFSLELPMPLTQPAQVQVFDAHGRQVWAQTVSPMAGAKLDIELEHPAAGIYFVAVEAGASVWVKKVRVE